MCEFDTVVKHSRPGSSHIWEDRAWFRANSEEELLQKVQKYYRTWSFDVLVVRVCNACSACVHTDEDGLPI